MVNFAIAGLFILNAANLDARINSGRVDRQGDQVRAR